MNQARFLELATLLLGATPGPYYSDNIGYLWVNDGVDSMLADFPEPRIGENESEDAYLLRMRGVGHGWKRGQIVANGRLLAASWEGLRDLLLDWARAHEVEPALIASIAALDKGDAGVGHPWRYRLCLLIEGEPRWIGFRTMEQALARFQQERSLARMVPYYGFIDTHTDEVYPEGETDPATARTIRAITSCPTLRV